MDKISAVKVRVRPLPTNYYYCYYCKLEMWSIIAVKLKVNVRPMPTNYCYCYYCQLEMCICIT